MRIYNDFKLAMSEIKRDIVEMGIRVHPHTWQDRDVENDPNYSSLELQNYVYSVVHPRYEALPYHKLYCEEEWSDRLKGVWGHPVNPGESWKTRPEVWTQFIQLDGKLGYSYSDRFAKHMQVSKIIDRLREDPDSRQCFISIWDPSDINKLGGISRIPCSLGYQLQVRKDKVNLTYLQRSCDFATHYANDVALACMMQHYIANELEYEVGPYTHWIASLHLFKKDAEGVF